MWLDDIDKGTNQNPLLQLKRMLLGYQPPCRLGVCVMPGGVLVGEFIGSGEHLVAANIQVPFE